MDACAASVAARVATPAARAVVSVARSGKEARLASLPSPRLPQPRQRPARLPLSRRRPPTAQGHLSELWAALKAAGAAEAQAAALAGRLLPHCVEPLLRSGATAATAAMNPPGAPVAMLTWTLSRPPGAAAGPPASPATAALGPFAAAAAALQFVARRLPPPSPLALGTLFL